MARLRPRLKNMKTKTKVVETIKDEIIQFGLRLISEFSLRPRLIKTGNFTDIVPRLGNSIEVETETFRD